MTVLVVFLDGVDGSGKTTLADHLIGHPQLHPHVRLVAPLWRYLPSVPAPRTFADWVTTTPAADVAAELLAGQQRRIDTIAADPLDPHAVILVDRGPKTVEASALAHIHTRHPALSGDTLEPSRAALRAAVTRLAATLPCLSIERATASTLADRLADHERRDLAYLAYHRAFVQYFQITDPAAGVHVLRLAAIDPAAHSVAVAAATIHALTRTS